MIVANYSFPWDHGHQYDDKVFFYLPIFLFEYNTTMANIFPIASWLASNPSIWNGWVVPTTGDRVFIPPANEVILDWAYTWGDESNATIVINGVSTTRSITVQGKLIHSRTVNSSLTCRGNFFCGWNANATHDMGTDASPIPESVTARILWNLSLTSPSDGKFGIIYDDLWKFTSKSGRTIIRNATLTASASAGATSIEVSQASGWKAGDEIIIGMGDYSNPINATNSYRHQYVIIAPSYTPWSLTVPITTPLAFSKVSGTPVSNIAYNISMESADATRLAYYQSNITTTTPVWWRVFKDIAILNPSNLFPYVGFYMSQANNFTATPYVNPYTIENVLFSRRANLTGGNLKIQSVSLNEAPTFSGCTFINIRADNTAVWSPLNDLSWANIINSNMYWWATETSSLANQSIINNCHLNLVFGSSKLSGVWRSPRIVNTKFSGVGTAVWEQVSTAPWAVNREMVWCDFQTLANPAIINTIWLQTNTTNYTVTMTDCLLNSNDTISKASSLNLTSDSFVKVVNRNGDITLQEDFRRFGSSIRDNAVSYRSTSDIRMTANQANTDFTRDIAISVVWWETVRIVGYLRYDSNYATSTYVPPIATLYGTINNIALTPSTFTCPTAQPNVWHKYDLSITNTTSVAGVVYLQAKINTATIAWLVYLDGTIDNPFIVRARHYWFTFDEANIKRVVNPHTVATEAVASGYTGVSINATTKKVSFSLWTADTAQKFYDYSQYWGVTNLAEDMPFVRSGSTYSVRSLWSIVEPTYSGIDWSNGIIEFTSVWNKTISANNCTFVFTVWWTYDFGSSSLSGNTTLVNTSSSPVTVRLNNGVSYTNIWPSITVELPVVTATFTISGMPTLWTRRLEVYNITQDNIVYTGTPSGSSYSENYLDGQVGKFTAWDNVRIRFAEVNGSTSFKTFQTIATASASGFAVTVNAESDPVYAFNAIDGSTITKFQADYVETNIDLIIGSNFIASELYAFYCFSLTSILGINQFWWWVTAIDIANYRINTAILPLLVDNVVNASFYQTDNARIFRDDGLRPVKNPTTSGYTIDINWQNVVYIAQVSGSPVITGTVAEVISEINSAKNSIKGADNKDLTQVFNNSNSWWLTPEQETLLENTVKKWDVFLNSWSLSISL